ncbi:RNA polymerase sigma factor [Polyangium jinanense]|uniref:RNA polymerase sigma factor n=1 Tax=Polyangium jinanense TaxID=2829994 RepID=A0A9X4AWX9_9BACT|nr:RNA polymerase sigma factor [Polyangium jinanense]MDC3987306.1 RNA polymerase sigma factor [Polyangium jinanense]
MQRQWVVNEETGEHSERITLDQSDLEKLRPYVCGIARRVGVIPADRDDLAQDVLFAFWRYSEERRIRVIEGKADVDAARTLIAAFAVRTSRYYRRRARRSGGGPADETPSRGGDPALRFEAREALRMVERLPPNLRRVVELDALEYTTSETAESVGVVLGTAKSRLSRARDLLAIMR